MGIKKANQGRRFRYEPSFRRKVCEEILEGKLTFSDLAKKHNISNGGNLYRWIEWYRAEQKELISSTHMETASSQLPVKSTDETPEPGLQEELRLAKAKIATLETMIDIAENQFKIAIRKKSGTKPSLE